MTYPWQHMQWSRVQQRLDAGTLPHALLLTGPSGLGKLEFARALAKRVLCGRPSGEGACGECRDCQLFEAGTHPDMHWVAPEEEGKAIKVDQIRPLADFVGLTRHRGEHKVAVIAPADAMNPNAANSLLKTLEEPTPGTILILVSARPGYLPATVRSRCQTLEFSTPPRGQALEWLKSRGIAADMLETVLAIGQGAPLRALELGSPERLELRQRFLTDLLALAGGELGAVEAAERWKGEDIEALIEWQLNWIQDVIRIAVTARVELARDPAAGRGLHALAESIDLSALFECHDALIEHRRLLVAPLNAQLRLEDSLLLWAALGAVRPRAA